MFTKTLIGVCVALLSGACSVDATDEPATSTTTQGLLWDCSGVDTWTRYWYMNNVEVGREQCACDGTVTKLGQRLGTYVQVAGSACGGGGGGGGDGCPPSGAPTGGASTSNVPPIGCS
jgi:hypothetical protein